MFDIAVLYPNVFDFKIRISHFMEPVDVGDAVVWCVDVYIVTFTSVESPTRMK